MTPCPECRVGKHGNCDRTTWDVEHDQPAPCPCDAAGHGTRELDEMFTAGEAAELLGLTPATVRQWKHRGHIVEAGRDDRGRPLYLGMDLLRAEAATRTHARRA